MVRNMRSALLALGFAGAAYAWKNREQLQQRFGARGFRTNPPQLPDHRSGDAFQPSEQNNSWDSSRERQFGGADI